MNKIILSIIFVFCFVGVAFSAPADMYVTTTGAGGKTGADWANAMAWSDFETDFEGASEAGDRYFFMQGTYTLTSSLVSFADATDADPIQFIGVKTGTTAEPPTSADWAFGSNRALFTSSGQDYRILLRDYHNVYNIQIISDAYYALAVDYGNNIYNCKIATSNNIGTSLNFDESRSNVIASEIYHSGTGDAIKDSSGIYQATMMFNYFHDSSSILTISTGSVFVGNIVDNFTTFSVLTGLNYVTGNVFYNMTTCLSVATGSQRVFIFNNIFDHCTTGASAVDSNPKNVYLDYNLFSNNTTDVTNIINGPNNVYSDVTFTDASNGDFTLPDSSAAEGVAAIVGSRVGLTGDYNVNIGVDQTDTQGGEVSYGYAN